MVKKLFWLASSFLIVSILYFIHFLLKPDCPFYSMDVHNPTMGDYTIVALRQGCGLARGHYEYYVKRNDDETDGYRKKNLIVETRDGHAVNVKWMESNVIQVKYHGEETLRKISKSVFANDIKIEHLDWTNTVSSK